MNCPKCGNRPLTFSKWLCKLNLFRIQCSHCNAHLEAGFMPYLWTLGHIPIGVGLVWVGERFYQARLFSSSWGLVGFFVGAAAVLFCTAYVIPYFAFSRVLRIIPTES